MRNLIPRRRVRAYFIRGEKRTPPPLWRALMLLAQSLPARYRALVAWAESGMRGSVRDALHQE